MIEAVAVDAHGISWTNILGQFDEINRVLAAIGREVSPKQYHHPTDFLSPIKPKNSADTNR